MRSQRDRLPFLNETAALVECEGILEKAIYRPTECILDLTAQSRFVNYPADSDIRSPENEQRRDLAAENRVKEGSSVMSIDRLTVECLIAEVVLCVQGFSILLCYGRGRETDDSA